jgi:capsular polysaccharide biosynthesis protein
LRENYLSFLRKVQQAELAESLEAAQQGARFSIADQAEPPRVPTTTRLMDLLMGVLASFGLAAGVGILLEALDPVLVSKDQIESAGDRPVLGSAPRLA